jgi:hypothetical protein
MMNKPLTNISFFYNSSCLIIILLYKFWNECLRSYQLGKGEK